MHRFAERKSEERLVKENWGEAGLDDRDILWKIWRHIHPVLCFTYSAGICNAFCQLHSLYFEIFSAGFL